ncbi:MAG TPA: hypothetical protein VFE17_10000 [Candidatus Baltobacteraceae bacterium]|jgi:hypothetical protein|nr:hypothetical protein [Candidatus Baltobacteraceae bacterium]
MAAPDQLNAPIADYGSPLQVLGRVSSLSKYDKATGVVQFLTDSNKVACAAVNFGPSPETKGNNVKLVPLSAFSRVPVTGDEVRIDVGEEREGDKRGFVRRALESVGVLKQSTKVFAVVTASASEQDPGQNPHIEPRPQPSTQRESDPFTRILTRIDSVISRIVESFSAVARAASALRRPAKSVTLNPKSADAVIGKPIAERDASAGRAGLVEITASQAPPLGPRPAAPQATKDAPVPEREKRIRYADLNPLAQRVPQPVPYELAGSQPIQYQTPNFKEPEHAVRIAGTSKAEQPRISASSIEGPRRRASAVHDMPQPQRGAWFPGLSQREPGRIAIEIKFVEKAQLYTVREIIPQVAQRGLWATEAGKEITPQARTKAARSKEDVRAIAVEQARKHAQRQKSQDQEKQPER